MDNFQRGKFPFAAPRISGPYLVLKPEEHILQTTWKCGLPSEMKRGGGTFRSMTPRLDEPILNKTPVPDARLAEYWRWLTDQEIKRGRVVGPFDFFGSNVPLERVFNYIEENWHVKIDRKAFPELVLVSNK